MDKIDQQYLNEIVGGQEAGDPDAQDDLKVHEENTTIEELEVGKSKIFKLNKLKRKSLMRGAQSRRPTHKILPLAENTASHPVLLFLFTGSNISVPLQFCSFGSD